MSRSRSTASKLTELNAPNAVTWVLALSVTLVRASNSYFKTGTTPAVVLIFLACILWALPRQRRNVFLTGSALMVFAYVADVSLALIRGARDGANSTMTGAEGRIVLYVLLVALGIVAVTSASNTAERDQRLIAILLAPAIYALVNGVLLIGGVQPPTVTGANGGGTVGSQSQLLGFLGISGTRAKFPLATSVNLYSIVISGAFAGLAVLRIRARGHLPGWAIWTGMAVCVIEIVIGDSRTTLLAALVVVAVFLIWRRFIGTVTVPLLMPLFPLIVIGALELFASSGVASIFNRGGAVGQNNLGSVATGTGRVYIWRGAWAVIKHFRLQDVIGWGAGGQIPSGASQHYLFVFPNDPEAYTAFTHDVTLQVLLDEGYLGLLILVATLVWIMVLLKRHLRREPASPAVGLLAMLLVFILSGATEVSPTYYTEEVLAMTLLIAGAVVGLAGAPMTTPGAPQRTRREARPVKRQHPAVDLDPGST